MFVYSKTDKLTYQESAEFALDLPRKLQEQRLKGNICDIHLRTCDQDVPAHRVVLCAHSPYFETMFTADFQEKEKNTVMMSDSIFSHESLLALVDYMYTGKIEISGDTLEDILSGASLFLLENVKGHCAQFMITNLSPINCIRMWALADLYGLNAVGNICKDMAKSRFHDFIQHRDEVLETSGSFMLKLLQEGVMDFLTFEETLSLILRWVDHQPEDRVGDGVTVLHCLAHVFRFKDRMVKFDLSHLHRNSASYDDVKDILTETLNQEDVHKEYEDQDTKENVIVSWVSSADYTKTGADFQMHVQMHMYHPKFNRWYTKELNLPQGKRIISFIGCTQSKLVFQTYSGQELVLHDLETGIFQVAPDPLEAVQNSVVLPQPVATSSYRRRAYFLHNKCVLCLVGNEYDYGVLMLTELSRTQRMLLSLDPTTCTWTKFGELPPGPSDYTWIEHRGSVYVLSYTSGSHDFGLNVLTDWFKISSKNDTFEVTHLAKTHFAGDTIGVFGSRWAIQGVGENIVIGKEISLEEHVYNIPSDSWSFQKRVALEMPAMIPPLRGALKGNTRVHLSGEDTGDSNCRATMYYLEVLCPYVCRFWSCDHTHLAQQQEPPEDSDKEVVPQWRPLAPPSTEKLRDLLSCQIPANVLSCVTPASYPDMSEEKGQSPLSHCRLPNHSRHITSINEIKSGLDFSTPNLLPYYDDQFSDFEDDDNDDKTGIDEELWPEWCFVDEDEDDEEDEDEDDDDFWA